MDSSDLSGNPSISEWSPFEKQTKAAPPKLQRLHRFFLCHFILERLLVLLVLLAAWKTGVALRQWTWDNTADIHWRSNIEHAYEWGSLVLDPPDRDRPAGATSWADLWSGYRVLYDRVEGDESYPGGLLDYSPARLLATAVWARHERLTHPPARRWRMAFTDFMLNLNTAAGVLGAIAAFLLVQHWVRVDGRTPASESGREGASEPAKPDGSAGPLAPSRKNLITHRLDPRIPADRRRIRLAATCGLIAGLLFWFNAAAILEGHAWPQWDIWPIPFFLFAAYLASTHRWARAGAVLAAGALFKGQILFVVAFFVLWPLFQFRVMAVVRLVIGFAFVGTLAGSIWLVHGWGMGAIVYGSAIIGAISAVWISHGWERFCRTHPNVGHWWTRLLVILRYAKGSSFFCESARSFGVPQDDEMALATIREIETRPTPVTDGSFAIVHDNERVVKVTRESIFKRLRPRVAFTAAMAVFAVAVILVGRFDRDASMAWFRVSYMVGTEKYPLMARNCACNLPAILAQSFGWDLHDVVWPNVRGGIEMRSLLVGCYIVTLIISAAAGAWQAARRSRYFLIAVALPWLLLFTFVTQMDGRYLLYAATVSCVLAGASAGFTLLHLLITAMNFAMMFKFLTQNHSETWPAATAALQNIEPGLGWTVLLTAAMLLYSAWRPLRRRRAIEPVAA